MKCLLAGETTKFRLFDIGPSSLLFTWVYLRLFHDGLGANARRTKPKGERPSKQHEKRVLLHAVISGQ